MAEYFGATVADIFRTMPERFKPEEARDVDILIGYEATGEGGGKWTAHIKHGTLTVNRVEDLTGCKTTVHADAETFVGVTLGKITPIDALTSQKLRVVGDARLLMTLLPKVFVPFTAPPKKKAIAARDILAAMESLFRPDRAKDIVMNIGYDLTGPDGGQWTLQIAGGQCKVREGFAQHLNVKLIMDTGVYAGMMTGELDAATVFTSGQVRIEGDMMAAAATSKFFHRYVAPGAQEAEELICLRVTNAIEQRFASGPAMGMWFAGLREKKFLANKCPKCHRTQIPPREICAICRVRVDEYVELGPAGTVTNFDIVYFASPDPLTGAVRDTPYAPVYVVLDGATKSEAFAFELKKEDIGRVRVGVRVRPVWAEKPTGSFKDLLYFELES